MIYKEMTGRLGNQLFQYATIKAYKKKYNLDDPIVLDFSKLKLLGTEDEGFCDELKYFKTNYLTNRIKVRRLLVLFNIFINKFIFSYLYKNNEKKVYNFQKKHQHFFNKIGLFFFSFGYVEFEKTNKKNKYFYGDFESPKYFDFIKTDLMKEFEPKKEVLKTNLELYKQIIESESVCISIRRGDFVSNETIKKKHYICNPKYYYKSIEYIKKNVKKPRFVVFSDDIKWCKENLDFPDNTLYESGQDPVWEKLRLMYSCKHFIISNSTFSWWAQYLSRNDKKIVVAPDRWKNYSYKKDGTFDIYEDNWEKIKVGDINE